MKKFLFLSLIVLFLAACDEVEETMSYVDDTEESELTLSNGCKDGEEYIENEDTCVIPIECEDYYTCIDWSNELIASLEDLYGSLTAEESIATDDNSLTLLTTYEIDNEAEEIITEDDVTDEELEWHADLWFSFSWLIPEEYRENINQFEVFESGSTLAYVNINDDDGEYWTLGMNNENIELASETMITYIHEYAHYLSLNMEEVDYFVDEEECTSIYLEDTGCLYENSYIYDFYQQFWADGSEEDYDDFVSEYAMTSPEEDFAESFAHFVLTETPEGDTLAEEKILFFYEYEELVQLRTEILSRAATWLDRSVIM